MDSVFVLFHNGDKEVRMDKSLLVSDRFFKWADENKLKCRELAEKIGISSQAITNWKTRGIPSGKWQSVAKIMSIPVEVLTASGDDFSIRSGKAMMLPLISSVHAGEWTGVSDATYEEYVPVLAKCSKDSFCLTVEGDSMRPTFLDGDIVAVDPAVMPRPGDVVVAIKCGDGEATLKRYRAIGLNDRGDEVFELVPDNEMYASYRSDQARLQVIGVVVSFQRNFR